MSASRIATIALGLTLAWGATASAQVKDFVLQAGSPVPFVNLTPAYIAQQAGLFAEEGLNVDIRYSPGAGPAAQLLAAGNADVGYMTIDPTILGYEKGIKTKALWRTVNHLIYFVAVPDGSAVRSLKDLEGKKVGVSNIGTSALPVIKSILRSAGVETTIDSFVPVGFNDQALAALNSGQVQALGHFDGMYYGLERAGHKFQYFSHPTLGKFGNAAVVSTDATIAAKKDQLCGFGRAMAKATLMMQTNPEAALRAWWKAAPAARGTAPEAEAIKSGMIEMQQTAAAMENNYLPAAKFGVFDEKEFQAYIDLMQSEGALKSAPPLADVLSKDFIDCINEFDADKVRGMAKTWAP